MSEYIFNDEIVDNDNLPEDIKPYSDGRPIYKVVGELIRCKYCKYFNGDNHWCDFDHNVTSIDYCSSAERKEE